VSASFVALLIQAPAEISEAAAYPFLIACRIASNFF